MKIAASILIMYFGLLMGQPFVNMGLKVTNKPGNCRSNDMCCKEKARHQDEAPGKDHNGGCNRDFCNPFVPCGTSMPATKPVHSFKDVIRELTVNLTPATNDDIVSNYLSDCWRPPKLLS
ncbi:hypothetical protein [Mucilaginibacter sp.]|uniref:hypothetical protein n=1 Tax=Mucilaginibacter sp. TaxID=1882438 RepID=UPI002B7070E4|nr:hypothetical protein [Mucilaginibacter sp.]HTI58523.1 hypothetical protein [Mucilaginibacter sp.]